MRRLRIGGNCAGIAFKGNLQCSPASARRGPRPGAALLRRPGRTRRPGARSKHWAPSTSLGRPRGPRAASPGPCGKTYSPLSGYFIAVQDSQSATEPVIRIECGTGTTIQPVLLDGSVGSSYRGPGRHGPERRAAIAEHRWPITKPVGSSSWVGPPGFLCEIAGPVVRCIAVVGARHVLLVWGRGKAE
jgi:hypothetical protein